MEVQNKTLKYICIGLGTALVVLLLAVAFLLGQRAGMKNNGGNTPTETNATEGGDLTGTYSKTGETEQQPALPPTDAPRNLDISMSAGTLTFTSGDAFGVQFDDSVIVAENNGDTLFIENKQRHPTASERRRMDVTVTVPDGFSFDDVDIEFGAGKLIMHTLTADALNLQLGAGSAMLDRLNITGSATIQEGAGELVVKDATIADLTLQCGAGATRISAALTGVSKIDAAVGAVDLDLDGTEEDYTVTFKMGLGACYFNNDKLARSGSFGTGQNRVDVTGGLGVMRVNVG